MAEQHTTALFDFSLQRQDSTAAAKNFLTLENPSTSGRLFWVGGVFVSYMTTVASPLFPIRGYRLTASPTGGTLHDESEICRFDTQRFAPKAIVRSANPTVALGAAFFSAPPGIAQGQNSSSPIEQIDAPLGFNPFTLYPGESVVLRQDAGAPGHLWNISILWRELAR